MPPRKKAATKPAAKKTASTPSTPPTPDAVATTGTPDVKQGVEKSAAAKAPELGSAAERRADYLRALEEERRMCVAAGKDDRVKAIDAELKRAKSGITARRTPAKDEA